MSWICADIDKSRYYRYISPEGGQGVNTEAAKKTEPPKTGVETQGDDHPKARRGAATKMLPCTFEEPSRHDLEGEDENALNT